MRVLFIDPVAPKPYDDATLLDTPQGGTESTVTRITQGLSAKRHVVFIEQAQRTTPSDNAMGKFLPMNSVKEGDVDFVVVLRDAGTLPATRARFPNAKLYLWLHDIIGMEMAHAVPMLAATKTTVLCVSEYHRTQVVQALMVGGYSGQFSVKRIYNPISEYLKPDSTPVDKNKLVFFSSPHKGLERTLDVFKHLRGFNPSFNLYVANPGYYADRETRAHPGVVGVGQLTHSAVMEHVRSALCVFHMNDVFPETFGLVYAEANAVGTPFIAHQLGAIHEVSDHPSQIVNVKNNKQVIDRVMAWHDGGRPSVRGNPVFRLNAICQEWERLLH